MGFNVQEQAGDDDTIMVSRKASPHTNTEMVWVMTRAELEALKSKIDTYLGGEI